MESLELEVGGVQSSLLAVVRLQKLLDVRVDMSRRQLDVQVCSSGGDQNLSAESGLRSILHK